MEVGRKPNVGELQLVSPEIRDNFRWSGVHSDTILISNAKRNTTILDKSCLKYNVTNNVTIILLGYETYRVLKNGHIDIITCVYSNVKLKTA